MTHGLPDSPPIQSRITYGPPKDHARTTRINRNACITPRKSPDFTTDIPNQSRKPQDPPGPPRDEPRTGPDQGSKRGVRRVFHGRAPDGEKN